MEICDICKMPFGNGEEFVKQTVVLENGTTIVKFFHLDCKPVVVH